jgi:hypothetical protein
MYNILSTGRASVSVMPCYCVPLVFKPTNNSLYIFSVCFEGSPPTEEPRGCMLRELPNFLCSHVPMEIFLFHKMGKK